MIFGLLYFCAVILCVNRSRTSFILYRIVKRHSRQSNVRRIWTCADNDLQPRKFVVVFFNLFANHITLDNEYMRCAHKRQNDITNYCEAKETTNLQIS